MSFWELQETVGRYWHRWAGAAASYPHHPQAAVRLEELSARLAVFYRGLGGSGGVRLAGGGPVASRHRLRLRQRLGLGDEERLERPAFDGETLTLPERVDCFPDRSLNVQLYFWLAAFFAHAPDAWPRSDDALQRDVLALRLADRATRHVLRDWPGLRASHSALSRAARAMRGRRALAGVEAGLEEVVVHLLGDEPPKSDAGRALLAAVRGEPDGVPRLSAPRGYRPFLPAPIWGVVIERHRSRTGSRGEEPGGGGADGGERRLQARRRGLDESRRRDALVMFPLEHVPMLAEMANLNRPVEDDDLEGARQAAEALDEIALGSHEARASTRLRLDLDVGSETVATGALAGERTYPEWDYTRRRYLPDHCRVLAEPATEEGSDWQPDAEARRRIRAVRRQFEALRPKRQVFPAQRDGAELDLNALVRSHTDRLAGGPGSDRVYLEARNAERDLAVAILVDASLSADSWVDNRRVLDVEKEAVLCLSHGLAACGDDHGIYAFTSRKRHAVTVRTIKEFEDPLNAVVRRRLEALTPGYYTRMGAAVRHVAARLAERVNRHRLLLLLTDGKPNDLDHYEGRYGVEDTRRAIREARRQGLAVFGITVDRKARDYFPYLFGGGAYAIVGRVARLPAALPALYRQITR
ncbi:protein norD [Sulfurifustis variabilis]|uniref:Protein norD n=1 Tax=Sulfurifustis variabilis TaxID=1675686 RepID=A0A1B4VD88_9GAMM|nr:VWA domain-containing protein [Sulfurifustis variabilis]BAU47517.1 protein norD [Sulfurifustis variabilis]